MANSRTDTKIHRMSLEHLTGTRDFENTTMVGVCHSNVGLDYNPKCKIQTRESTLMIE